MSRAILANFDSAAGLTDAARAAREAKFEVADAFSPFPLEDVLTHPPATGAVGWAAAAGGGLAAVGMFALESWSAGINYPFNSGDRPLFSWPVFLIAPFEIGILAAGVCGFIAFLVGAGLPQLNHPAFDIEAMDLATQDRFLLAVADPGERRAALDALLVRAGAGEVTEVEL